ncbi:MAG: hypothetical protein IBX62_01160 [Coriobacteriia bacterium]|nr:hypothetical protein [Coriobacteriia bacterium]
MAVKEHVGLSLRVHALAATLPRHDWRSDERALPPNGIYLMFERGERVRTPDGPVDRVVRVASHRKPGRLPKRVRATFGSPYSGQLRHAPPLRAHYSEALLRREAASPPGVGGPRFEDRVTQAIRLSFTFCVIPVEDADERYEFERSLIALLAQYPAAAPSSRWLGRFSSEAAIAKGGLWNVKHAGARAMDGGQFERFRCRAEGSVGGAAGEDEVAGLYRGSAQTSAVHAAESLFLGALWWLRSTYAQHGFASRRDLVWTLQKRLASVSRRTFRGCRVYTAVPEPYGGRPIDLAVVDENDEFLVAVCVVYEPDARRRSGDLRYARLPRTSWEEVAAEGKRTRDLVAAGRVPVAYTLLVDEGGRYRDRDLPGSLREEWAPPEHPALAVMRLRAGR